MKKFQISKLKEFREAAGLTQFELAQRLGVFVQQVSAWEKNPNSGMTAGNLGKVAEALGKTTDDFFEEAT